MSLLAITRPELFRIRAAIHEIVEALPLDALDDKGRLSSLRDALSIINAIIDQGVVVVPRDEMEQEQDEMPTELRVQGEV